MKYYVDFAGWCEVEAKDKNAAEEKFWTLVNEDASLPCNVFEVQGIEEKEN